MVVIAKRSNIIPVDFGEFKLEYQANDENIKRMKEIGENLQKRGEDLKKYDGDDAIEKLHDVVKASWVELFDEEAFNKVYDFSGKTTTDTMIYLIEAIKGIVAEFENRHSQDSLKKYLAE